MQARVLSYLIITCDELAEMLIKDKDRHFVDLPLAKPADFYPNEDRTHVCHLPSLRHIGSTRL